MWMKQETFVRIEARGALLSLPALEGTRRDVYVCNVTRKMNSPQLYYQTKSVFNLP